MFYIWNKNYKFSCLLINTVMSNAFFVNFVAVQSFRSFSQWAQIHFGGSTFCGTSVASSPVHQRTGKLPFKVEDNSKKWSALLPCGHAVTTQRMTIFFKFLRMRIEKCNYLVSENLPQNEFRQVILNYVRRVPHK